MTRATFDLIILGGGSAGIVAGVMAGGLKLRVLLIEKARLGGECSNTGCVPSKALLHAARTARILRTAGEVGLRPVALSREEAAGALEYVRATVERVREADASEKLLRDYGVDIRFGAARFIDAHTVALDGARLRADHFLIATGSRPAVPEIPGLETFLTNQNVFDLREIPESLLVVGGGPIGVELGQAFALLGSRVTLLQRGDRPLPRDDAELTRALESCLRADGLDIRLNTTLIGLRRKRDGYIATTSTGAEIACSQLLLASGRLPNARELNLEFAGVRWGDDGIAVDSALRTTAPHIYACGDVLGRYQFSHMAEYEAKLAVRNIVFPGSSRTDFRLAPWTTFTDPELAHCGLTEEQARAQGISYQVCRQPFGQNDRALTENEASGLVKVLTHGLTGRVIGVHILGPRAGELIHEWVALMERGGSIREVADRIHVYPTLSMASQHAAQRWYEQKAQDPLVSRTLETYVRTVRPRQGWIAAGLAAGASCAGLLAVAGRVRRRRRKTVRAINRG